MAVGEVLRALDLLASQRNRRSARFDANANAAQNRLGTALSGLAERDAREQMQEDRFRRQAELEQQRRREQERAATVADAQERLRQIEGNRALFDAAEIPRPEGLGAMDPIAARQFAANVMQQRGYDAKNAADLAQAQLEAQAEQREAQAAQAQRQAELQQRARAEGLPAVEPIPGQGFMGMPAFAPWRSTGAITSMADRLSGEAERMAEQAELARIQQEQNPTVQARRAIEAMRSGMFKEMYGSKAPVNVINEIIDNAPPEEQGELRNQMMDDLAVATREWLERQKAESGSDVPAWDKRQRESELDRQISEARKQVDALPSPEEMASMSELEMLKLSTDYEVEPDVLLERARDAQAALHAAMMKRNEWARDLGQEVPFPEIE